MKETKINLATTYGEMKGDHDCKNCENCTCGKNKINFPERLPEIGHEKFYEFMGWNKIDSKITEVDKLLSLIEENNLENSPIYALVRDYFYTNIKEIKRIIKNRFTNKITNLINNNCKKVMVLYHDLDIDGHFVKIISQLFKELDLVDFEFEFLSCVKSADERFNDIKEKINDIDLCLIGDLSFSEEISKEINKLDTDKIVLLDHHAQATYLNEYDWAMVYPHDIYNFNISSGTLLIYHFISEFSNKNSFQIYIEALANCVASYDTWFLNDLKTKKFGELYFGHLGNDLSILFKYIDKTDFDLLMISMFANNIIYNPDKEKFYDPILYINRNYLSNEYEQIIKIENRNIEKSCMMAYNSMSVCEIYQGCKFAVVYISDGYASQIGNYISEKQPEIDFVVIIMMGIFTVSFRSRTDEVNVGMLAKLNEGGGHQAASGITLYNKNIRMLYDQSPRNIIIDIMSKVLDEKELIQRLKINHIKSFEYDKEKDKFIIE